MQVTVTVVNIPADLWMYSAGVWKDNAWIFSTEGAWLQKNNTVVHFTLPDEEGNIFTIGYLTFTGDHEFIPVITADENIQITESGDYILDFSTKKLTKAAIAPPPATSLLPWVLGIAAGLLVLRGVFKKKKGG